MKVKQIHPLFAGEASGIDLSKPLAADDVEAINEAMNEYAVLVFRDQPLTQTQQVELAKSFGPLDFGFKRLKKAPDRMEHAELADISNVADAGGTVGRNDRKIVSNIANQLWHSDSSFQKPAARYSMLAAVRVPGSGGDTEYADLRSAYDALPEETKREIEGLQAEHYALHSRFLLGDTEYDEEQRNMLPPVLWPLVRTHAGSGRKHLFIGVHTRAIEGWTIAEGRMLLMDLLEHATQREFVYKHKWRPNDLVIWDNRCTLHRGRRFDLNQPRELRRATTLDVDHADQAAA
ncbi:MAG: TauD/TfdA family dioxygenase [Rhizobiaceae bacterium]|nr:TauD/TfdA family dioxygenase [Rhizobiaceae bacterium]